MLFFSIKFNPRGISGFFMQKLGESIIHDTFVKKDILSFSQFTTVSLQKLFSLVPFMKEVATNVLTSTLIKQKAGKQTVFLHPLPRVGEILRGVDKNKNALYLRNEIKNGMYVRMGLVSLILGRIK